MKKLAVGLSLCLLAATAALTLPAAGRSSGRQEVDPDTLRVLWADESHQVPSFIPQALIGDLDLTSSETVDLSHLPMTEGQEASFKNILFYEPKTPDGCLPSPIAVRTGHRPKSLSTIELLGNKRLVTSATVIKVVPGWLTSVSMPANMIFLEVNETLQDLDQVAASGGTVVFIQISGAVLVVNGKRICSPEYGEFQVKGGETVLLFGFADPSEVGKVVGGVFEIRGSTVYPNPRHRLLKVSETEPIPLWDLREKLEHFAEIEQ